MQHDVIEQADRAAEKALEDQREAEKKAIADQQAVRDKLSAEVAERDRTQLEAYHANKDVAGLPAAPAAPARIDGTQQQEEEGKKALQAYKEAGFLATSDKTPAPSIQAGGADHALAAEKEFRDRQQQLADKITDPKTNAEQRERLELVKTTEYHNHKAEQLERVVEMQTVAARQSGGDTKTSERWMRERQQEIDHHKSQAALAAQQLHTFDHARNAVPKEVQARMGQAAQQPHIQHQHQGQKDLASDPHLQALAHGVGEKQSESTATAKEGCGHTTNKDLPEAQNPAAARMLARIKAAGERNDTKTTPDMDQRMQEIGASREKLAASQELQKTEALGRKAELEQRAAVRH
jgi:hypothetical protein